MPAAPEENDGQDKASRLPPELQFLAEVPDFSKMDFEEKIAFARRRLKKIRQHRDALIAFGLDPDKAIVEIEKSLRAARKAIRESNAAEDKLLHSHADVADAYTDLVKGIQAFIEAADPFDPRVQEWKEELEEMLKDIPKE